MLGEISQAEFNPIPLTRPARILINNKIFSILFSQISNQ